MTLAHPNLSRLTSIVNILALLAVSILPLTLPQTAHAADITWDGGGTTANWSEDANWSGDVEPTSADNVIFIKNN